MTLGGREGVAAAVLQVISDLGPAERLAAEGRWYVEAHHRWDAGARRLVEVYEGVRSGVGATT